MRIILLLFIALCFAACETSTVDEGCAPTDFERRHEMDTLFFGTWKWHYTVLTCTSYEDSSDIHYDTIRQGEYVPWLQGTYPEKTIQIGDDLIRTDKFGTQHNCLTDWRAGMYQTGVYVEIYYTSVLFPGVKLYLSMTHHNEITDASICEVFPRISERDNCAMADVGPGYSTTRDFYIKVY